METFFALLTLYEGNPPVISAFPSQRPVTWIFDIFDLSLNKRLSKQSRRRWFETPSRSLCEHCNGPLMFYKRAPCWQSGRPWLWRRTCVDNVMCCDYRCYSDVTWASRRLKPPIAWPFIEQRTQAKCTSISESQALGEENLPVTGGPGKRFHVMTSSWLCNKSHIKSTLRWRHNGGDSVSNHQPNDCLLNRLFGRRSK